jgi:hypothetical protein
MEKTKKRFEVKHTTDETGATCANGSWGGDYYDTLQDAVDYVVSAVIQGVRGLGTYGIFDLVNGKMYTVEERYTDNPYETKYIAVEVD